MIGHLWQDDRWKELIEAVRAIGGAEGNLRQIMAKYDAAHRVWIEAAENRIDVTLADCQKGLLDGAQHAIKTMSESTTRTLEKQWDRIQNAEAKVVELLHRVEALEKGNEPWQP